MNAGLLPYRCHRCNQNYAENQLRQIRAGSGVAMACPTCGDLAHQEASRTARPLPALLATAFAYPFRGTTLMWTLAVLVATTLLQLIPFVGGLLAVSAELGFLFGVLRSTAAGQSALDVEAGDISDTSLWLTPLFKYLGAVLVSFGPAVIVSFALGAAGAPTPSLMPIVYAVGALGLVYFPAALVVAAHADGCLGVFHPAAGFAFIARIPGPYFITLAFLAIASSVGTAMIAAAVQVDVPLVGLLARSIASLYGPLVAMRMLGLLMEEHAEEL